MLSIALVAMIIFSNLKRKIFTYGSKENRVLLLFIVSTGIFVLYSYIVACCTLGSLLYIIAIFNYIISVIDIYKVARLFIANNKK